MSAPSVLRGKYFEGSGVVGIFIGTVAFALLAPLAGGLIDGIDRKLSARMQGRVGPRLLQPFYDVAKLLRKAPASVNTMDDTYMACALIFTVVGGGIFVSGSNTLLCAFMVTLAAIFVVLASASTQSPFAQVGADRELLQVMSYEPAVLLMSVGLYLATDSFDSIAVTGQSAPIIVYSAPIFLALLAVLTIKLRKSPFDLSYSHHAHQEIVQGVATEMSGGTLAKMTLMHWCETVLFLMWVGMFFVWDNPVSWVVALVVMAATYFVEVLIDNTFARSTWRSCLSSAGAWRWCLACSTLCPSSSTCLFRRRHPWIIKCRARVGLIHYRRLELQRDAYRGAGLAHAAVRLRSALAWSNTRQPQACGYLFGDGVGQCPEPAVVRQIYNQMLEPSAWWPAVSAHARAAYSAMPTRDRRRGPRDSRGRVRARVRHSPRDGDRCHRGGVRHPGPEGDRVARRWRSAHRGRCRYLGRWR